MTNQENLITELCSFKYRLNTVLEELKDHTEEYNLSEMNVEQRSQFLLLLVLKNGSLENAVSNIENLFKEIVQEGVLYKNRNNRYSLSSDDDGFHCGSTCEVFLPWEPDEYRDDEEPLNMTWIPTRIEHKNGDYYFTTRPNIKMAGAKIRIRRSKE